MMALNPKADTGNIHYKNGQKLQSNSLNITCLFNVNQNAERNVAETCDI